VKELLPICLEALVLFTSNRLMMRILIAGAVIMLATPIAGCSQVGDEKSETEPTTVLAGPGNSEPATEPTGTSEPVATIEPTLEPSKTPEPAANPTATLRPTKEPSPTPDIQMFANLDLPAGDPFNGKLVAVRFLCRRCHLKPEHAAVAFAGADGLPPIMERGEVRIADPDYTGMATSNLEYIFESIYFPDRYVVDGEWVEAMPETFGYRLTDPQDLADLLAWLEGQNDPDFEHK
jgi:hypothetical protein